MDPVSRKKKSLTAPSREAAELLKQQICAQLESLQPIALHDAISQYLDDKASAVQPEWLRTLGERLRAFLPNEPVTAISAERACALYAAETKRVGRNQRIISASTHQHLLRTVKEFWTWLVKRKLARSNPFAEVDPIGKASAGKEQPRQSDAKVLDDLLFSHAKRGDEGALALLMQMYLGNRSSEILSLEIADVERSGDEYSVTVERGKTKNAKRVLELYPAVGELLWRHCQGRPRTERIFAANLPARPAPDWLNKRLKAFCREAGLREYCPHSLRGLHSSLALLRGATTHQVAASLGHASFSTTARHYADPAAIENARTRRVAQALRGDGLAQAIDKLSDAERLHVLALLQNKKSGPAM